TPPSSTPSNSTDPCERRTSPMIARSVVVLPTPLRPSSAAASPAFTSRLTPCRMCSLPIWTCRSRRLSMGGLLDIVLVLRATEIGFSHALVSGDLSGAAGGQHAALCHHGDIVGDFEHHLHVMLDDDNIDRARQFADLRHCPFGFRRSHAAGRLVEKKQPWLRD